MTIAVLIPLGAFNSCGIDPNNPPSKGLFSGSYTDYNAYWFVEIGEIISLTAYLNTVVLPIAILLMQGLAKLLSLCKDKGKCTCSSKYDKTKTTTINAYVDLYTGPEF
eukprot:CAMPEP_0116872634 /NCGR_PEP_ID=MMETSP0463-20121206/3432_1 /TAXON_ID=181622 /ORGANISM="Strombidinopsis sp, Strain SopsisLIS2011" /LENGTH=107 /DNA_ID=CAMNT_0004513147 /DNA_START=2611 /DNA_END=2934 /DNA_ORIENTATION=+